MTLAPAPPTRIQLCGPTVIEMAGQRVDGPLPGRQGRVLFAYLVLEIGTGSPVATNWPRRCGPSSCPAASETAVNALLSKLRKAIGQDVIDGRSSVRLRWTTAAWVDVEVAEAAVHRAESRIVLDDCKSGVGIVTGRRSS